MAFPSVPRGRLVLAWVLVFGTGAAVWWGVSRLEPGAVKTVVTVLAVVAGALVLLLVYLWLFEENRR
jgi:hypothetical protein